MEKDIRESIALKRFEIISPVLAEPTRAQNEYFRQQAEREHPFPHYGLRKVRVSTMKTWLKKYRKDGFDALKPKSRADGGRPKRLDEQTSKGLRSNAKPTPTSQPRGSMKTCGRRISWVNPQFTTTLCSGS